jgi:hypothetical protein
MRFRIDYNDPTVDITVIAASPSENTSPIKKKIAVTARVRTPSQ